MPGPRFVDTTREKAPQARSEVAADPVLVVAHHPAFARVGDTYVLGDVTELSRLAPIFGPVFATHAARVTTSPLDDPFISRTPLALRRIGDELEIDNPGVEATLDGKPLPRTQRITAAELARGLDLVLGGRVVLWLTTTREHTGASDELGMIGASRCLHDLRTSIRQLAGARGPILVLGETGTGKELVARAIAGCARPDGPFAAVNVAAIPAPVATAELFGHEKGAFTGATEQRRGYFERASTGVLFLDEIGDLPESVQPILLRTLESGEIQPVGAPPRHVDTLVVAATDSDLAAATAAGRFRAPLYHRLAAVTLRVPPLRERRGDIGLLLAKFLTDELSLGHAALDSTTETTPWLPAPLVADLVRASWPGNIRQLRAVATRLAALARAGRTVTREALGLGIDAEVLASRTDGLQGGSGEGSSSEERSREGAAGSNEAGEAARQPVDDARLVATLREHRFQLARAAEALGISRTHLDALIAKSSTLRKAKDLGSDEIVACREAVGADLDAMAAKLEVSPRGLKLRMRQLDLE